VAFSVLHGVLLDEMYLWTGVETGDNNVTVNHHILILLLSSK